LGDTTGLYHGTQQINQGQMDRWNIVSALNYLPNEIEEKIVLAKVPTFVGKNEKLINQENNIELFSIVKNSQLFELLKKSLSKSKYFKIINLKNSKLLEKYELVINTEFSNFFTKLKNLFFLIAKSCLYLDFSSR